MRPVPSPETDDGVDSVAHHLTGSHLTVSGYGKARTRGGPDRTHRERFPEVADTCVADGETGSRLYGSLGQL